MDAYAARTLARRPIRRDVRIDGANAKRIEREIEASRGTERAKEKVRDFASRYGHPNPSKE